MARAMLVGCGCCARAAGSLLRERGWAVRGTTRGGSLEAIEAAGLEAAVADPDRVGTVSELTGDVAVVAWLFGDGVEPAAASELNGSRLGSLLAKLVDTPVRGFVFERPADGTGVELVEDAVARWRLPAEVVDIARDDPEAWAEAVADAVERSVGLG